MSDIVGKHSNTFSNYTLTYRSRKLIKRTTAGSTVLFWFLWQLRTISTAKGFFLFLCVSPFVISQPNRFPKYEMIELAESLQRNGSLSENDVLLEKEKQKQNKTKQHAWFPENHNLRPLPSHSPSIACVRGIYGLSPIPSRQVSTSLESPGGDDYIFPIKKAIIANTV